MYVPSSNMEKKIPLFVSRRFARCAHLFVIVRWILWYLLSILWYLLSSLGGAQCYAFVFGEFKWVVFEFLCHFE